MHTFPWEALLTRDTAIRSPNGDTRDTSGEKLPSPNHEAENEIPLLLEQRNVAKISSGHGAERLEKTSWIAVTACKG